MTSLINRMAFTTGRLATKGVIFAGKGLWAAAKAPVATGKSFYEGCKAAVEDPAPVELELVTPDPAPENKPEAPKKPRVRKSPVRKSTAK